METDLLGRPKPSRSVNASDKSSADGGGSYSFIIHGNMKKKKDDEEEKEKKHAQSGPAVNVSLSKKAQSELTHEHDAAETQHQQIEDNTYNVKKPKHKIDIKV